MAKWSNIYSWQNHFHLLLNAGNNCYVNVKSIEADNGSNVRFEYEKCLFLQPFKPLLYPLANSLKWCPYIFLFHVLKVNTYCSRPAKDIGPGRCPLWIPCPSTSKYTLSESSVDCLPTLPPPPTHPSPTFRKVNPFAHGNFAEKRVLKFVERRTGGYGRLKGEWVIMGRLRSEVQPPYLYICPFHWQMVPLSHIWFKRANPV